MEIDDLRGESCTSSEPILSEESLSEYHSDVEFSINQGQSGSRKRKFMEGSAEDDNNASSSDRQPPFLKALHVHESGPANENGIMLYDPQPAAKAVQVDENLGGFSLFADFKSAQNDTSRANEGCPGDENDLIFYAPQHPSNALRVDETSVANDMNASFSEPLLNLTGDENGMMAQLSEAVPNELDANPVGHGSNESSSGAHQDTSKMLQVIETFFKNNAGLLDAHLASQELNVGERFEGNGRGENHASTSSAHPSLSSFQIEKGFGMDEAYASLREFQSASLSLQESLVGMVTNEGLSYPESVSTASLLGDQLTRDENGDESDRSTMDLQSPLRESCVEGNNVGDENEADVGNPQSAARRKKYILLSAVAAVFSTLTVTLASVGELLEQLQIQMRAMARPKSTHFQKESSMHRYFSGLGRGSSSLHDNSTLVFLFLLMLERKKTQKKPRELTGPWYIKPRTVQGFQTFLDFNPREDPERFRDLFRISPDLFYHICEMVSDDMLSDTPRSLRVLPNRVLTVERQVAIALRRLATGNQFLGIADSFGVSKSTAVKVTWKFVLAFIKRARGQHLSWPRGEDLDNVKDGFRSRWGLPNCCGVVDGTHFTVEFPKGEDVTAYYDCKNHVSISMQAIVDSDLRFLDVVVGWPGSIQDYQLLSYTNFYKSVMFTNDRLNGESFVTGDGSFVREYVIGDGGYPLYDWLIVPFPAGLSAPKDAWNLRHSEAMQCADEALRRLKGTWRLLSRILWKPRRERIGKMVFACCLLHNMIIDRKDGLSPQVFEGVDPHPGGYSGVSVPTTAVFERGPEARDALVKEIMGEYVE